MGDQENRDAAAGASGGNERLVVQVGGEMDIARAPMLLAALCAAITQPGGPGEIAVDVAELSFCDSSGLNALLEARHLAHQHGRRISLRSPQPQLLHLLELTGTGLLFPVSKD
ncbi:STAS domain-containing protein [Streptomyces sp. NPDC006544]|uniref:STAS domain-containing protein n=1 Tax=Streptomyces sp. NPDC006544 TaxID=3154583 RepID=UPI0033BC59CF